MGYTGAMPPQPEDDTGSLERARKRLYEPAGATLEASPEVTAEKQRSFPHAWEQKTKTPAPYQQKRHVHFASIFFMIAVLFFLISLSIAGYFFYFGGNTVSVDKITIDIQGPTSIAGGETASFSLVITNENPVAIDNVTLEITFPEGTRTEDLLKAYPRYTEDLGTLASGAVVTRSLKAALFGGTGATLNLPISFSYTTTGSNAVFVKKVSYPLSISSSPLSVSVETLSETVAGKPLTLTLTVRSNATVPLDNVVLLSTLPFGFSVISSSVPLNNGSFLLGTVAPGTNKEITLVGALLGQDKEQRTFKFTVGTANAPQEQAPAITYMTQDATVTIAAPFINTTLALNGNTSSSVVVQPGSRQSVTLSYTNTLLTSVTNATIEVAISGPAVDYDSIKTTSGFYRSSDHTIVFSKDTDSSLSNLAPGASGIGAFTFATLPAEALPTSPTLTFTISVSGTRVGQTNVPEEVTSTASKTAKVATAVVLSANSSYLSGNVVNTGPIPPQANKATTYAIVLQANNKGSAVAGGMVSTVLPSYVTYTGVTNGKGTFSYDTTSRTVSWNIGDIAQNGNALATFQVSFTPSTSQKGTEPNLTGPFSFKGHDRFAGVQISATADAVTTETKGDPGYSPAKATVQ